MTDPIREQITVLELQAATDEIIADVIHTAMDDLKTQFSDDVREAVILIQHVWADRGYPVQSPAEFAFRWTSVTPERRTGFVESIKTVLVRQRELDREMTL